MNRPAQRRVSVVVPTCNRPAFLREALASIRALEGPDLAFEIIVGDNGEPGPAAEVAAASRTGACPSPSRRARSRT